MLRNSPRPPTARPRRPPRRSAGRAGRRASAPAGAPGDRRRPQPLTGRCSTGPPSGGCSRRPTTRSGWASWPRPPRSSEMRRIVTELPVFQPRRDRPAPRRRGRRRSRPAGRAGPTARWAVAPGQPVGRAGRGGGRARGGCWCSSLSYAEHLVHEPRRRGWPSAVGGRPAPQCPSPLRNCSSSAAISSPLGTSTSSPDGRALLGVEGRLEPADHVEMLGVGPDQLVDLVAGGLAGRPQR